MSREADMRYRLGILLGVTLLVAWWLWRPAKPQYQFQKKVNIQLREGGVEYPYMTGEAKTVGDFLSQQGIVMTDGDQVFPPLGTPLTSGVTIFLKHQREVTVSIGSEETTYRTTAGTVGEFLQEVHIGLDEDDIVVPTLETTLGLAGAVQITRVSVSEEKEEVKIPFKTEEQEDPNLSWRKKEVVQKGEVGIRTRTVRIARHDGKEVSRKILSEEITKEPVTEIIKQGTLVKTGKSHSGGASWYAHTGTLAAANPWLPMGSYVKVTNTANGKSVIVKINDRGPFGAGRIIDLDKVAFQEIASLGQGVINVKMEEITN